jgi:hypothetical protein
VGRQCATATVTCSLRCAAVCWLLVHSTETLRHCLATHPITHCWCACRLHGGQYKDVGRQCAAAIVTCSLHCAAVFWLLLRLQAPWRPTQRCGCGQDQVGTRAFFHVVVLALLILARFGPDLNSGQQLLQRIWLRLLCGWRQQQKLTSAFTTFACRLRCKWHVQPHTLASSPVAGSLQAPWRPTQRCGCGQDQVGTVRG